MAIRSYQDELDNRHQRCLDELERILREHDYAEEHLPVMMQTFRYVLQDYDDPFVIKLVTDHDKGLYTGSSYRKYVCRILAAEPVPAEPYQDLLRKFLKESHQTRVHHSNYLGPLFSIERELTNSEQKKKEFYDMRIKKDKTIFGQDKEGVKLAIQGKNIPLAKYFSKEEPFTTSRNIHNHIHFIEILLREFAKKTAEYYYIPMIYKDHISNEVIETLKKIADIDMPGICHGLGLKFKPETKIADLKHTLLSLKKTLPNARNSTILNDIRRSFFLSQKFKEVKRKAKIDYPRVKKLTSLLEKMLRIERETGKPIFVGNIPDISGARLNAPDYFYMENIMNLFRCSYLEEMILEEQNLYTENPSKAYRDIKLTSLIICSNSGAPISQLMSLEDQIVLERAAVFQNLEHVLYKHAEEIPQDWQEEMKQILLGPMLMTQLRELEEYNKINEQYLQWLEAVPF